MATREQVLTAVSNTIRVRHFSLRTEDAYQAVMGHKQLETTMGYIHRDALAARSPIDELEVSK